RARARGVRVRPGHARGGGSRGVRRPRPDAAVHARVPTRPHRRGAARVAGAAGGLHEGAGAAMRERREMRVGRAGARASAGSVVGPGSRAAAKVAGPEAPVARPRLGFLGVGWIGGHRLQAVANSGLAEVAAIADPVAEMVGMAAAVAPEAAQVRSLDELLRLELDGVVIATPSALHAEQSIAA